jgi:hypothetical protein
MRKTMMPNHHPAELIDIYQKECADLREELYKKIHELGEIKSNGGLVVHALDCALALTEQLFIFLPEGTSLPSAVATCKHNLDAAMTKLHRPPAPQQFVVGDNALTGLPDRREETLVDVNQIITAEVEPGEETQRLRRALVVAAANIATLSDQAHEMVRALNAAIQLVDGVIGEMAAKGVQPTPVLIALHNQFTREMNTVFKVPGVQKHAQRKLIS